ncbi:MAG: NUDIX domain-containing protein [Actinobacteria bacterium]|nr:NUDIX domain-containing protein [Actinomycetota bacterium]
MPTRVIAATWLSRREDAVLAVRPHYVDAYFLPGGIPENGESYAEAAVREVYEELGLRLDISSLRELIRVEDQAYGGAPGDIVSLICFGGTADGVLRAGDEIAKVAWLAPPEWHLFAPAVQKALAQLAGGA